MGCLGDVESADSSLWLWLKHMSVSHIPLSAITLWKSSCELLSNSLMHTNSLKIRNRVERNIFLLSDFSVYTLIEVNMLISVSGLDGVSSAPGYLLTSSATFATTEDNHFFFMNCQINVGNKPCQLNRVALLCILLIFDILHRLQWNFMVQYWFPFS